MEFQVIFPSLRGDHILFYEYFHGDNGAGLGASHQTCWTGLVAKVIELYGFLDPKQALQVGRPRSSRRVAPRGSEELEWELQRVAGLTSGLIQFVHVAAVAGKALAAPIRFFPGRLESIREKKRTSAVCD